MAKPTPLQFRNLLVALLAAAAAIWNLVTNSGPWWLTAIFGVCCVLALASAAMNGNREA